MLLMMLNALLIQIQMMIKLIIKYLKIFLLYAGAWISILMKK